MTPGPLRHPAFRWFFAGRVVSLLGSSMAPVALAFAVLDVSDHMGDLGIVLAARSVPMLIFLLLGGAVADRFPRSTVLRLSNLGAGTTQGVVAFMLLSGGYHLAAIAVLQFVNGALTAFTTPAVRGIVPQLVADLHKQRANSLLGSAKNAISILGPAVAGVIVTTAGGGWAIAIDAVSYLIAALCMARLPLSGRPPTRGTTVLTDIRDGWAEFRSLTWVCVIVAAFSVTNCIYVGIWTVLGPTIAERSIGAASWGVVLGARAIGILLMSMIMYRLRARRLLMLGQTCIVAGSLPLIILGAQNGVVWLVLAAFVAGLGSGVFGVAWETSLQQHVPNAVLSRISAYDDLGSFIAVPIGQIAVAPTAEAFGDTTVTLIGGVTFALVALIPLLFPQVRNLRQPQTSPSAA
ncbi:MFS transporter [Nonomuraea rhodomycinica]|uniref:MFS transporter n=1 Tax=Nonomuraea rhodomycinica TaxID=1712872 RepID=A0A7Y6ILX8_9ACTN|nr:MFS transporter [Nonomuraea rhodomycinica]NUW40195.1 MFS transporter [Nonomuraea rhodomycinica]